MGTNDAVAFSASVAPALTVPIASIIATNVMPTGTLSEGADVASTAASLAAIRPTGAIGAPDASLDKLRETGDPPLGKLLLLPLERIIRAILEV